MATVEDTAVRYPAAVLEARHPFLEASLGIHAADVVFWNLLNLGRVVDRPIPQVVEDALKRLDVIEVDAIGRALAHSSIVLDAETAFLPIESAAKGCCRVLPSDEAGHSGVTDCFAVVADVAMKSSSGHLGVRRPCGTIY